MLHHMGADRAAGQRPAGPGRLPRSVCSPAVREQRSERRLATEARKLEEEAIAQDRRDYELHKIEVALGKRDPDAPAPRRYALMTARGVIANAISDARQVEHRMGHFRDHELLKG